jgi:hypothetical protein
MPESPRGGLPGTFGTEVRLSWVPSRGRAKPFWNESARHRRNSCATLTPRNIEGLGREVDLRVRGADQLVCRAEQLARGIRAKPQKEIPRLCRGGSSSLTFPGVSSSVTRSLKEKVSRRRKLWWRVTSLLNGQTAPTGTTSP